MKRIIGLLLALIIALSCAAVGVSAEGKEEKIIFEYDIYDSTTFGYECVYASIFAEYSEVNKLWTLEDFPGVKAYSVKDTWAMSEEAAESYIPPKNFHQILKFDIIDKTPEGCLEAIRALEASEYVKSVNPQVYGSFGGMGGWDPIVDYPVDPFADGIVFGDANLDGSVDMKDVLLIRRIIAGLEPPRHIAYADVNQNGEIDMKDVLLIRKMIAGLV